MRYDYWLLGVFTLLFLLILCFIAFPIILIIAGLITGAISIYYAQSTSVADKVISIGAYTWKHPVFFLFMIAAITFSFVLLTDIVHHSRRFKHIKVKLKKRK